MILTKTLVQSLTELKIYQFVTGISTVFVAGYNFERRDHPSNIRRGGVGVYYKECLPLKTLDITYLQECLNFEIKIRRKTCNFVCLYRYPSQNNDQFETFLENLNLNLDQILQKTSFVTVALGDAKC